MARVLGGNNSDRWEMAIRGPRELALTHSGEKMEVENYGVMELINGV